ncbi:unnamed protein product [Lathyrus sativus]|nr:unnamed protein product [Lathyrus sativus]
MELEYPEFLITILPSDGQRQSLLALVCLASLQSTGIWVYVERLSDDKWCQLFLWGNVGRTDLCGYYVNWVSRNLSSNKRNYNRSYKPTGGKFML